MRYFVGIIALLWMLMSVNVDAGPVSKIVGVNADATGSPPPIPLTLSTLCTVSCAFRSSPSYANATEFWAASGVGLGACVRSTDGGATWPACTTQPFASGGNEVYAGASDGSVIAAGTTTGPTTCTVSRSTDNATSWSVVFTQAVDCNPGNNEGQYLYCLSNGRCEWMTKGASTFRIFRSTDNGQNWSIGETGDSFCAARAGATWNGTVGMIPPEDPGCGGGSIAKSFVAAGDVWSESTVWTGTQGDCWGSVVYNGSIRAVCQGAGAAPDGRYTLRSSTGANIASLDLPGAVIVSIDAGGVAMAPFTNTLYIFASRAADTGVYVSIDNLVTFYLIGTIAGTMRGGNVFYANGCVYATTGTTKRFVKICL